MKVVLSFPIKPDNKEIATQLESAFKLGLPVQLSVKTFSDFEECEDKIAEVLSTYSNQVISIRGPKTARPGSTIFEDTVLLATRLEDFFDVSLLFISTFYRDSYRHVEDLIDFYNGTTFINVQGISDPISTMTMITESNQINRFNRITGLVFDVTSLGGMWINDSIIHALKDCIYEVYYKINLTLDPRLHRVFRKYCRKAFLTVKFNTEDYVENREKVTYAISRLLS